MATLSDWEDFALPLLFLTNNSSHVCSWNKYKSFIKRVLVLLLCHKDKTATTPSLLLNYFIGEPVEGHRETAAATERNHLNASSAVFARPRISFVQLILMTNEELMNP